MTITDINANSGAIQALSTIVLVLITIYYSWQTRLAVEEAKKSRNDSRLPILRLNQISGALSYSNDVTKGSVVLCLDNIGYGVAIDVGIKLPSKDYFAIQNINFNEESVTNNIQFDSSYSDTLRKLSPEDRIIIVEYSDIFKRRIRTIINFDIEKEYFSRNFSWRVELPK